MIHSPLSSPSVRGAGMPRRLDRVAHARCQRLGLPVARARGDDHALEQRRQVLGVEDHDVLGLDVFQTIDDGALQLADVHSAPGWASRTGALVELVSLNIACDRRGTRSGDRLARGDARRGCRSTRSSIIGSATALVRRARDLRVDRRASRRARLATASVTRPSSSRQSRQVCRPAYWSWPRIRNHSASGSAACELAHGVERVAGAARGAARMRSSTKRGSPAIASRTIASRSARRR